MRQSSSKRDCQDRHSASLVYLTPSGPRGTDPLPTPSFGINFPTNSVLILSLGRYIETRKRIGLGKIYLKSPRLFRNEAILSAHPSFVRISRGRTPATIIFRKGEGRKIKMLKYAKRTQFIVLATLSMDYEEFWVI